MRLAVLADFGSTFTKVTLVEAATGQPVAHAEAPTTVRSDVMEGYREALRMASDQCPAGVEFREALAASSAGGGLRVAAVGLVAELTAAAARQAALNAGARVERVLAGPLGPADAAALAESRPDIVLFCGGTDGGQRAMVLENARVLAGAVPDAHVIVACNCRASAEVAELFEAAGQRTDVVDNVMPRIGSLTIEPARAAISQAFIAHVIEGKGLSASAEFGRAVVMPTPEAVLATARLLATGTDVDGPVGDVVVVDVGGATTDVHSALGTVDPDPGVTQPLVPVLPVTRSVQGDLGMRWSAAGVLEADRAWITERLLSAGHDRVDLEAAASARGDRPAELPRDDAAAAVDRALAIACVTHALARHCGHRSLRHSPNSSPHLVQHGPDLREVDLVVGTGGVLVHRPDGKEIVEEALSRLPERSLAPRAPRVVIDHSYGLAAAGLLATRHPRSAFRLASSLLREPSSCA